MTASQQIRRIQPKQAAFCRLPALRTGLSVHYRNDKQPTASAITIAKNENQRTGDYYSTASIPSAAIFRTQLRCLRRQSDAPSLPLGMPSHLCESASPLIRSDFTVRVVALSNSESFWMSAVSVCARPKVLFSNCRCWPPAPLEKPKHHEKLSASACAAAAPREKTKPRKYNVAFTFAPLYTHRNQIVPPAGSTAGKKFRGDSAASNSRCKYEQRKKAPAADFCRQAAVSVRRKIAVSRQKAAFRFA